MRSFLSAAVLAQCAVLCFPQFRVEAQSLSSTASASTSASASVSVSASESVSVSASRSGSVTLVTSRTQSSSRSVSMTLPSSTLSESLRSRTESSSFTLPSATESRSQTDSTSLSLPTASSSASVTQSRSASYSVSRSVSGSKSGTMSRSMSATQSGSRTESGSVTFSRSGSVTYSRSATVSRSVSGSRSRSATWSGSVTMSSSLTLPTATGSKTLGTASQSLSLPTGTLSMTLPSGTASASMTLPSATGSATLPSATRSESLPSPSASLTMRTQSASTSLSRSWSVTLPTASRSASLRTRSASTTLRTQSQTLPPSTTKTLRSKTRSTSLTLPSATDTATYTGSATLPTATATATFACPPGKLHSADQTCIVSAVAAFKLRYTGVSLDALSSAQRDGISDAVCSDLAATLGLYAYERCGVSGLTAGSVVAGVVLEAAGTVRAHELLSTVLAAVAGDDISLDAVQALWGSGVGLDTRHTGGATVDGVDASITVPCTPADCNAQGRALGLRPYCQCSCENGFQGNSCEHSPSCAVQLDDATLCEPTKDAYLACEETRCSCQGGGSVLNAVTNECTYGNASCAARSQCFAEFLVCMAPFRRVDTCTPIRTYCCNDLLAGLGCSETCNGVTTSDNGSTEEFPWWAAVLIILGCSCLCACFFLAKRAYDLDNKRGRRTLHSREPAALELEDTPKTEVMDNPPPRHSTIPLSRPHGTAPPPSQQPIVSPHKGPGRGRPIRQFPAPPPLQLDAMEERTSSPSPRRDTGRFTQASQGQVSPRQGSPRCSSPRQMSPTLAGRVVQSRRFPDAVSEPRSPTLSVLSGSVVLSRGEIAALSRPEVLRFVEGNKGRVVTIAGLPSGRAVYKLGDSHRPSFQEVHHTGDFLSFPETERSIRLPPPGHTRDGLLKDLKAFFDGYHVTHDILRSTGSVASPIRRVMTPPQDSLDVRFEMSTAGSERGLLREASSSTLHRSASTQVLSQPPPPPDYSSVHITGGTPRDTFIEGPYLSTPLAGLPPQRR